MDNLQLTQGGSFALNSAALANGTTAGTIKTTVVLNYTVDGTFYQKAITDNQVPTVAIPATFSTPSNGSFTGATVGGSVRLYGLYYDKTGALVVYPGRITNSADLSNGVDTLQFPANIKGKACFGVLRIAVTAGTTFIPGVTSLVAAGVTASYLNLFSIPAEPLET